MSRRILLVEDELALQNVIKLNLELEGYLVLCSEDGIAALKRFNKNRFDLVILDVMLPEMDGFNVCQTIRLQDQNVPILFLTAKDSSQDRIRGLKLGGDDYLVKPFNLEEMLLRVKKLLERTGNNNKTGDSYEFSGNRIDFASYVVYNKKSETKKMTEKEAKLLRLLTNKEGVVVSRNEILESVWGYDVYPTTRTIDNFILGFRKFFESDSKEPEHFISIRGVGYKFIR